MSFEFELSAGFSELVSEAGTKDQLTFKGIAVVGVIDHGDEEHMRVDTAMGKTRLSRLTIARTELAKLPGLPKVGETFVYGGKTMRIEDDEDADPTDVTVTYLVKRPKGA